MQYQEIKEIAGQHFRLHITVTENAVTIQKITLPYDTERNLLQVMDKEILKQLHEELVHKHLNHIA
jgi:hypothetical protein